MTETKSGVQCVLNQRIKPPSQIVDFSMLSVKNRLHIIYEVHISLGYYTTKSTKKQVNKGVLSIFVNYANFYVNIVM